MHWLAYKIVAWFIHALVVLASVAVASPGNPRNTFGRALVVTFLVALIVTPFAWIWWLLIPGIIALIAWFAIYMLAYNIGFLRAFVAGILQALIGVGVDYLLSGLAHHPHHW